MRIPLFNYLKKAYFQISKYLWQFFPYKLFKYLKKYTSKSRNTYDNFLVIHFLSISKSIHASLEIPRTIFCLYTFKIFKKVYLQIWEYPGQFFAYPPFQIFKKSIVPNLKMPSTIFWLFSIQIFKKAYLEIWKYLGQFFAYSPFQILEKVYLQILTKCGPIFCLSPFLLISNI